jgi:hypothetical protein
MLFFAAGAASMPALACARLWIPACDGCFPMRYAAGCRDGRGCGNEARRCGGGGAEGIGGAGAGRGGGGEAALPRRSGLDFFSNRAAVEQL